MGQKEAPKAKAAPKPKAKPTPKPKPKGKKKASSPVTDEAKAFNHTTGEFFEKEEQAGGRHALGATHKCINIFYTAALLGDNLSLYADAMLERTDAQQEDREKASSEAASFDPFQHISPEETALLRALGRMGPDSTAAA